MSNTSISILFFVFPEISTNGNKLAPGNDQKIRFNSCLDWIFHCNKRIYQTMFVDPDDIGSHSISKGAATYCCAGVHPGPPIVSFSRPYNLLSKTKISEILKYWWRACRSNYNWYTTNKLWIWYQTSLFHISSHKWTTNQWFYIFGFSYSKFIVDDIYLS